jgi:predicted ATPase/DNA-binding winged helix-turn-helix (wHTH) protein
MDTGRKSIAPGYKFGELTVDPAAKRLARKGQPIAIGGRAFDLLLCLLEQPGAIVTREQITQRVWPGVYVSDGNLRVQISLLRKVLDDGLIVNVAGRGYTLAAHVETIDLPDQVASSEIAGEHHVGATPLIGRSAEIAAVTDLVATNRLVTIVGPGGVGKSSLADAVSQNFRKHAITRVDLSPASDGHSIVTALVRALGPVHKSSLKIAGIDVSYDDDIARLLIFDSCEHLPDVMEIVSGLLNQAERLRILCTSREPVRCANEQLFRLAALPVPPKDIASVQEAISFASVELLVSRGKTVLPDFEITAANLRTVVDLSRRLDGIPLAVELAMGRLDSLGLELIAGRLSGYQGLMVGHNRSKAPRHRTLAATLDWSYGLLDADEQRALRGLSAFAGDFSMDAAEFVLSRTDRSDVEPVDLIISLIEKSLIAVDLSGKLPRYRLLDTTRAFARDCFIRMPGEARQVLQRHATYVIDMLNRAQDDWHSMSEDEWLNEYSGCLDDVRAALDWSFAANGDPSCGVAITASAPTLWFRMSLVMEAKRRFEQAIDRLEKHPSGDPLRDFEVYAAMGATLNYTIGPGEEAAKIWDKAHAVAEELDSDDLRLRALWGIWLNKFSGMHLRESFDWAKRLTELASRSGSPPDVITSHRVSAVTLTFMGRMDDAHRHLEAISAKGDPGKSALVRIHFDHTLTTDSYRSAVLWFRGYHDRAIGLSEETVERASKSKHSMSLALTLVDGGCIVAYLSGEKALLAGYIDRLQNVSRQQAFGPWDGWCRCYEGCLLLLEGRHRDAIVALQDGLWRIAKTRWMIRKCMFVAALAECFIAVDEPGLASQALDDGLEAINATGELWAFPEMLRVKARALGIENVASNEPEKLLREAIAFSVKNGLLSWELRCSIDLAELLSRAGHAELGSHILTNVMTRLPEGHSRPDWSRANGVLKQVAAVA